jgi:hypothetical protein
MSFAPTGKTIDISNATTNQKYTGMTKERKASRFDRGEHGESMIPLFWQ